MSLEARLLCFLIALVLACIETVRSKSYGWASVAVLIAMSAYDTLQLSLDS